MLGYIWEYGTGGFGDFGGIGAYLSHVGEEQATFLVEWRPRIEWRAEDIMDGDATAGRLMPNSMVQASVGQLGHSGKKRDTSVDVHGCGEK